MTPDPNAPVASCPGCGQAMRSLELERKPLGTLTIDYCRDCQALWFDAFESVQLTPGATLDLFGAIRAATPVDRKPLPATLACPRCREPMRLTQDVQKTTRFSYHRCPYGHGRFTPFFQFLREKDFVRPLPAVELARLKSYVRVVRCSSCGAPIDLATQTACNYCRAPIAVLDSEAVARTVTSLGEAERRRTAIDPVAVADGLFTASRYQREFERQTAGPFGPTGTLDLIDTGLDVLATLLGR